MCLNNGEVGIIIRHLQPSFMGVLCAMRSFSFACPYDVEQTLGKKCKVYPYLRNRRHVCVSIPIKDNILCSNRVSLLMSIAI